MKRTVLLTLTGLACNMTYAATPSALRAEIYSRSAVELEWERQAAAGLSYEISRNGVVIGSTSGVSFYDESLEAGNSYIYEVVAVDQLDVRWPAATVAVDVPRGSIGIEDNSRTDPVAPPIVVEPPANFSARVYSNSSAELFWSRSELPGLVYEVTRDGVIQNTISGTSFYDDALQSDTSYVYSVVAIEDEQRSAPAIVMINTGTRTSSVESVDPVDLAIVEPAGFFTSDGYSEVNVVRLDVRTVTEVGECTVDDDSGCSLADVIADTDSSDDLTVDIAVHLQSDEFPDDGSVSNAEFRQRGGFTRLASQKSFRIKLDSNDDLWRNERRLQLNKMPYDQTRIRNKLAFDLMQDIPDLPSLRTQFVNLWIDDGSGAEDYGLFTHMEYVGKEFLVNRGLNKDDNIYKAEQFVFAPVDLDYLAVDEDGEPLDMDLFESRLEIKRGEEHSALIDMIEAVNDRSRSFESVLSEYFDEDNVLAWVTVNFLLHQVDAVTHNFYLYNPEGSSKFFFVPWDYDGAFELEQFPANNFDFDELQRRLYYGFSKGRASNFLDRYYRMEGIHRKITDKANELRGSYLSDTRISELSKAYSRVIAPFAGSLPDLEYNRNYDVSVSDTFTSFVNDSHAALLDYGIPFPPKLRDPVILEDTVVFEWKPAYDVREGEITYDIEISTSPAFERENSVFADFAIAEADSSGYAVSLDELPTGLMYVRLIARAVSNPSKNWQISNNNVTVDNIPHLGVIEFTIP